MKIAKVTRRGFYFILGVVVLLGVFGLMVGCTAVKEYRTGVEPVYYDHYDQQNPHAGAGVTNIIEVATNYTLGFVEFDDQGWLYDSKQTAGRSQLEIVTNRAAQELDTNGLLLVVFIHGWKHNARWDDSNVALFHNVLQTLGDIELASESNGVARRVFGVYVGWRGLSETVEPFEELSFFGRKNTAERVGHGAVVQLLSALEALRDQSNLTNTSGGRASTKLIAMGHSFGGDVLYCATSPVLTERTVEDYDPKGIQQPPKSFGDLVVLINPAFEAARFETIQRLGAADTNRDPSWVTNCTLAVFTSTGDTATGFWFPLGREVSTVFQRYADRQRQRAANIDAVGHYTPFINYDLKPMLQEPGEKIATSHVRTRTEDSLIDRRSIDEQLRGNWAKYGTKHHLDSNDLTYSFTNSNCRLIPATNFVAGNPFFNVRVSPAIIPDHDTIDTTNFQAFLIDFVGAFAHGGK